MKRAVELIKRFEGLELTAYPDPGTGADPWTIGYGTTRYPCGKAVQPGDRCTGADAEKFLHSDLLEIDATLRQLIPGWDELSDGQRVALLSFGYNVGSHFPAASGFDSMQRMMRDRAWHDAARVFGLYVRGGGGVLPGLVVRRKVEAQIFMEGLKMGVNLAVPHLSQLDNVERPHGSCNVTSVAMCLKFLYPDRNFGARPGTQLEDHLFRVLESKGRSRHDPYDLQWLIRYFNVKTEFRPDAKWGDAKQHLDNGKPLIVHGWFTESGHIIVIRGYDDQGWIVNDPYGEWFPSGYDTQIPGKELHYSDRMMRQRCGTDGDLWLHFVG